MKENERPIRHQRDPKLRPARPQYRRERPDVGIEWIPTSEAPTVDTVGVFPWKLAVSVKGESLAPQVNPHFLEAVDVETTNRVYGDWQAENDLSSDGRSYIDTIDYVFGNLINELMKPDGQVQEDPLFAGHTLNAFLILIDDTIKDKREHRYIIEKIDLAFDQFAQTWLEAAAKGPVHTIEKPAIEPYIDPRTLFHRNAASASFAINLVLQTPHSPVTPVEKEPDTPTKPTLTPFSQKLIYRIVNREFSPSKHVNKPTTPPL